MRRPINPNKHHKAPQRIFKRDNFRRFHVGVSLSEISAAWEKIALDALSKNYRIIDGPNISYDYHIVLTYTYEWDNINYACEKAQWDIVYPSV